MARIADVDSLGMQEEAELCWVEEVDPKGIHLHDGIRQCHQDALGETFEFLAVALSFPEEGEFLLDWWSVNAVIIDEFLSEQEETLIGTVGDEIG